MTAPSPAEVRAFVALPLPEAVKRLLGAHLEECRRALPGWSWVREEDLHLTLHFLGPLSQEGLEEVERSLQHLSWSWFQLRLGGWGRFGPAREPRVLFLELEDGRVDFIALAQTVQRLLVGSVLPPGPSAPHLTLARRRRERSEFFSQLPTPPDLPAFPAGPVVLFASGVGRVPHRPLASYPAQN